MTGRILCLGAAVSLCFDALAQGVGEGDSAAVFGSGNNFIGEYRYADFRTATESDNTAHVSLLNRGTASFGLSHRQGDLHRVQEGGVGNAMAFEAERHQSFPSRSMSVYGRFCFSQRHVKDRAWCDVLRPYDANPFFPGSAIRGSYDEQTFDLDGILAKVFGGKVVAGVELRYAMTDFSRLRDPRPRSQMLDYVVGPSVRFLLGAGNSALGLQLAYGRRKEKISSVSTVSSSSTIVYWQMSGLENAVGTISGFGGYNREWVNHKFGGEVSFDHKSDSYAMVAAVSLRRSTEYVYGTYKFEPGRMGGYDYGLQTSHKLWRRDVLHHLSLKATYREGYADEFMQSLVQTRDSLTGYTSSRYVRLITFKKRFQLQTLDANVGYVAHWLDGRSERAYAGLRLAYGRSNQEHLLPTSRLTRSRLRIGVEGGGVLFNSSLWAEVEAGYAPSTEARMTLADAAGLYAQSVLVPDLDFYRRDIADASLKLTLQRHNVLRHGQHLRWFVAAQGGYEGNSGGKSNANFALSLGVFY